MTEAKEETKTELFYEKNSSGYRDSNPRPSDLNLLEPVFLK